MLDSYFYQKLLGHEDGKVKLWISKLNSLKLITALDTARYFTTEDMADGSISEASMDDWPPIRKVGNFDPFTDDPRSGSDLAYNFELRESQFVGLQSRQ